MCIRCLKEGGVKESFFLGRRVGKFLLVFEKLYFGFINFLLYEDMKIVMFV